MSNVWEKNILLEKADKLVHEAYSVTKTFPKYEMFGISSQLRRAAVSVVLNMIEGYSRFKTTSHINFLEIAFGSLKETQYLIDFSFKEGYLKQNDGIRLRQMSEEISKMLYSKIRTMREKNEK